jgi:hypothetical protein
MAEKKQWTARERAEYDRIVDEKRAHAFPWLQVETNFLDTMEGKRLMAAGGAEYVGLYFILLFRLSNLLGHRYPVDSDEDWELYATDLGCDAAKAREFTEKCASIGLIERDLYAERRCVRSPLVDGTAEKVAAKVATGTVSRSRRGKGKKDGMKLVDVS